MKILKEFKYIIVLVLIIVSFVVVRSLRNNYFTLSFEESYDRSLSNDQFINITDYNKSQNQYLLIDLRDADLYRNSHYEHAVNIPFENLLNRSIFKKYKNKERKVLLYSESISKTVKAKLILNQLGIGNVYYLEVNENDLGLEKISDNEIFKYKFQPDTSIKLE